MLDDPVEDDDPAATHAVVVDTVQRTFDTVASTLAELRHRAVFAQLLANTQPIERALRAHCETHALEEWLAAAVKLFTLRQSLGIIEDAPAPSDERVLAAIYAGGLTVDDGRWIRAAAGIIDALKETKVGEDA
jgi:hypothetical protein